ncbi:hypothetical protein [Rhizobium rhizogenes]|uniref:hypothetical protein n=1 Tax=Rhizobium rhizogenes TaxID=359 RepID=UPI0024BDDF4B|nr:hypothetical protein [Rhizobium rhizogenes]MDJ1632300.1 hypothetical protein [Rhizobium rhizogenes]
MQKLEELIAALEKSVGPSRELDADITLSVIPEFSGWIKHPNLKNDSPSWMYGDLWPDHQQFHEWLMRKGAALSVQAKPFTSSIDAAIALTERLLPGWSWTTSDRNRRIIAPKREDGPWGAVNSPAWWDEDESDEYFEAFASTPAIALVLSTLRAKLSQEKNNA